jgi:ketose-bisphosphate aldolase
MTRLNTIAQRFHEGIEENQDNNQFCWHLGIELFNLFMERREVPSLRILNHIRIPYRDDNRFVWEFEEFDWDKGVDYLAASQRQVRRKVSIIEMANEVDCELAGDDAQEIWTCETEVMPYEDLGVSYNEMWGKEPISDPFHYQEWDYQIQLHRPDWVTLYERRQPKGDPEMIDDIITEYKPIAHRIKQIIDLLTPEGVQRVRNMEDGDEIDINAAIDAMVSIRMGEQPNPRITMRNVLKNRDLAVVVLMDLSESTNETVQGSDKTILQLTREASSLVATAINGIGDPFAIHGFASDGRHDVQYYRFKDFNQHFDDEAKSRLAGMQGGLSTRMGAAMRHAGRHLLKQAQRKKAAAAGHRWRTGGYRRARPAAPAPRHQEGGRGAVQPGHHDLLPDPGPQRGQLRQAHLRHEQLHHHRQRTAAAGEAPGTVRHHHQVGITPMALVNMRDMLEHAYRNRYAVGGFDLVGLDFLEAIIAAAERQRAPIILSLAESHFEYYDFELAMAATVAAARRTSVPVAIHLDHGASLESAVRGINLGCTGVMVDASTHPFEENIARTRAVVEMAHGCAVPVEGELGYVAGVEGEDAEKHPGEVIYTSPEEAAEYVQRSGVDFLAVSIGTVHGRMAGEPRLDLERLAAINERLGIPLVIHGGTGLSDAQFRALIERGVTKINYYTALADAAAARMRANAEADPRAGYTGLMKGVRAAIADEVERCIELWGGAGRADAYWPRPVPGARWNT